MRGDDIKKIKEEIVNLSKKIGSAMSEDLMIKSVKPGEIVLTDPSNDEVGILQKADQTKRDKILTKIGDDIKDDSDLQEKSGYSAKAAHSGHDIGKPGKNFSKIAQSAAKKYGSKAAGERVAGAILSKLRNESAQTDKELMIEGITMFMNGELDEKLKPSMGVGAYIDDFVHSKNKRFAGKSKEQRIKMAKGAYYGATKESAELTEAPAFNPQADYDAGFRYYVIDRQTKKVIGRYKSGSKASSIVDKKDNEYGGYRYSRQPVESFIKKEPAESTINEEEGSKEEVVAITVPLLIRMLEWSRESAGEDIQLHKLVEAMVAQFNGSDPLNSDDYESIISHVTPNDPEINDDGPDSSNEDMH